MLFIYIEREERWWERRAPARVREAAIVNPFAAAGCCYAGCCSPVHAVGRLLARWQLLAAASLCWLMLPASNIVLAAADCASDPFSSLSP